MTTRMWPIVELDCAARGEKAQLLDAMHATWITPWRLDRAGRTRVHPVVVGGLAAVLISCGCTCAANSSIEESPTCAQIEKAIRKRPGIPRPLYVDAVEGEGRELIYLEVDLDGDGVPDNVKRDCGSPTDGTCSLYVRLTKGGRYEFDERPFSLIQFRSKYYVLVGHSSSEKSTNRRLYMVTARGINRICKTF